jgi:phage antirepressor YoqD-like protein
VNELMIFNNPKFGEVRTITEDGKTLFCGSDVAKSLGYKRPNDAISAHCRGTVKRRIGVETGTKADGTPATQQKEMLFIPEGDIYRLAARSDLPGAAEFEGWIFDEVLPSIRQNGGYIAGQENMTPEELMAAALIMANKTIENQKLRLSTLTVQNQIMKPKADYFDDLVDRNLLTNFRDTAKQFHTKQNDFVSFLLGKKYIYRDKSGKLLPYQRYVDDGLFELKECVNDKSGWKGTQTLITPKGRETFRLLFIGAA